MDYTLKKVEAIVYRFDKTNPDLLGRVDYIVEDDEYGDKIAFSAEVYWCYDDNVDASFTSIELRSVYCRDGLADFVDVNRDKLICLGIQKFHEAEEAHPDIVKTRDEEY